MLCDVIAWGAADGHERGVILIPVQCSLDSLSAIAALTGPVLGYLAVLCPGQIWLDYPGDGVVQ